jgi:RNA polymerase sigma-70 factor, ECF subfamily
MADANGRLYWQVLVVRCQLGNREAFAELVGRCQPRLRGFLQKMLRGRGSLDDVAQEVWVDVFQGLGRLADPGAFLPWLYRIAHNRAFRVLRRRQEAVVSMEDRDVGYEAHEVEFSVDDAEAVHAALDELSPEHREALLLRFMEQMSYEDIARVMGCAVGTVRSRIHNGKVVLQRIIEGGKRT